MSPIPSRDDAELPELGLDTDLVCRLIELARPALAREEVGSIEDEDAENDPAYAALHADEAGTDPLELQIEAAIDGMNEEQQDRLLALVLVGRGDHDATEFSEALGDAAERRAGSGSVARSLVGTPLLTEHLEAGLEAFGLSCTGTGVASTDDTVSATASIESPQQAGERTDPATAQ